jgi:DNA-binding transcriptional ArsR family regulator
MAKKTAEQEWVETLKALADQTRLRMVRVLIDGSKSVGELAESLEISPYNASKHLRVLRGVGIVEVSQSGTRRECAIAENFRKKINREHVLDLGCCVFRLAQLGK